MLRSLWSPFKIHRSSLTKSPIARLKDKMQASKSSKQKADSEEKRKSGKRILKEIGKPRSRTNASPNLSDKDIKASVNISTVGPEKS